MPNVRLIVLVALLATVGAARAQNFGGPVGPVAIPDGAGACVSGAAVSVTAFVPPAFGCVAAITATVGITHTWYGDLLVNLTSPRGTTVALNFSGCQNSLDDASDLIGLYTLSDAAPVLWDDAAYATAGAVPPGTYSPESALASFQGEQGGGVWTLTVFDHYNGDVGTLLYFSLQLSTAPSGESFLVCQPGGAGGAIQVRHSGGVPFAPYLTGIVLGATPALGGWFNGLAIPVNALLAEISFGPPFNGLLDATGGHTFVVPAGVLPAGLVISHATFHFSPITGQPTYAPPAGAYTIL